MTEYSFKKDILTESYLHYLSLDYPEGENQEVRSYSILSVIAIILGMVSGSRLLQYMSDSTDVTIRYLENEVYWYMLPEKKSSSLQESQSNEVERVLVDQGKKLNRITYSLSVLTVAGTNFTDLIPAEYSNPTTLAE